MRPRILLSFAHPDDESFSSAGLARRYADRGAEIALVTATRGDAGKAGDPPLCSIEELPARREAELRSAAAILGISPVHVLDYRDRHLGDAPSDRIREELVRFVRMHRPHVVITFDPNGINGHPDHLAIARFTIDAVVAAADPRWYSGTRPHRVQRLLWTAPIPLWQAARSPDLGNEPGVDFAVDVSQYRGIKAEALRTHRTQHLSIDRYFFSNADVNRILSIEVFRQAWGQKSSPLYPQPGRPLLAEASKGLGTRRAAFDVRS
jgi:LmbE family N-acetylglucosaminyl deacetylase